MAVEAADRTRTHAAGAWLWTTVGVSVGGVFAARLLAPHGAASPAGAPPGAGLRWLLVIGSSWHVAATGWLASAAEFRTEVRLCPSRYLWSPLALICGAAVVAGALPPAAVTRLLIPYYGWQFWHYQRQNFGLVSLAAASRGARSLSRADRAALMLTGGAGTAALLTRPALLQLNVRPWFTVVQPVAVVVFAVGAAVGVRALLRRPSTERSAGFCAVHLMALLFFLPALLSSSPYAAVGGLVIAHGLQYLLLSGLVATGHRRGRDRVTQAIVLLAAAFAGALLLSAVSHLHEGGVAGRLLFGGYLGVVMSHFVIDARAWRLRDPFPRRFLASRIGFLLREPAADPSVSDIRSGPAEIRSAA